MRNDHPILVLCLHLEVSPSGYYDWQRRRLCPGPRAVADQALAQEIDQIHTRSRQTYGAPRVEKELRKKGHCHGRNRVARLMKQKGLCGRQKGRYRVQTTESNHDQPIAPNRLAQAPKATAPNQLWVADITYIETKEGWLYLAAVLDLYSRKIVGWAMSERIDTFLVLQALAMALAASAVLRPSCSSIPIAASNTPAATIAKPSAEAGLIASMSRRGNCLRQRHHGKLLGHPQTGTGLSPLLDTRAQARTQIFDYIETFYNRQRAHSALDYHSPVDFELLNN